jgi:hypothetical protein
MAFAAAKLMGLPNIERDVNGGKFVGINGLSVSEEDINIFRESVSGPSDTNTLESGLEAEEQARAETEQLAQEETLLSDDEAGGAVEDLDGLGGLLGAEGDVPVDAGASEDPLGDILNQ